MSSAADKTRNPEPRTRNNASTTVLAFDFGTRRIGVAVGDFETRLAHPLASITGADNRARFATVERLVAECVITSYSIHYTKLYEDDHVIVFVVNKRMVPMSTRL